MDPFDCAALKMDSTGFDHMQFYLVWGQPIANKRQSYGLVGSVMDQQVVGLVKSCMANKLRNHALLSLVAALMTFLDVTHESSRCHVTLHDQNALETLRARIVDTSCRPQDLIYDIALLCRAATYRHDEFAAVTHMNALRQIIDQMGGMQSFNAMETRYVLFTDHRLAYARLAPNVFTLQQQLTILGLHKSTEKEVNLSDVPPHPWRANLDLEMLANRLLLRLDGLCLPQSLGEIYRDTILCVQVLESTWNEPGSSSNVSWLTGKHLVISSRLLLMSFGEAYPADLRLQYESLRTVLILWDLLIVAGTSKGRARNVLPEIGNTVLEAKKAMWRPRIYEGFKKWNRTLREVPLSAAANDSQIFLRLTKVVREMEFDNDVQLGELMMRLHELEESHHRKKFRAAANG